jgi:WD40 repeat protein
LQRKLHYTGAMHRANESWQRGQAGRTLKLLESLRPASGVGDERGFEWYYLWRQCHEHHVQTRRPGLGPVRDLAVGSSGRPIILGTSAGGFLLDDEAGLPGTPPLTLPAPPRQGSGYAVRIGEMSGVSCVALSPGYDRVALLGESGRIEVYQIEPSTAGQTGESTPRTFRLLCGHKGKPIYRTATSLLVFSPDGRFVIAGAAPGVCLLDCESGEVVRSLASIPTINAIDGSPDGTFVAAVSNERDVRIYQISELADESSRGTVLGRHDVYVRSVAIAPDNEHVASGSEDGFVKIWNVRTGQLQKELAVQDSEVYSLDWSPDSRRLAVGGEEGTAIVIDWRTGERSIHPHTGPVRRVVFAGSETLLSASDDGSIKTWHPRSVPPTAILTGHSGLVRSVVFSPDGTTLASAGVDRVIRLWDRASGRLLRQLTGHRGTVTHLAYAPDGSLLASSNGPGVVSDGETPEHGVVYLWELASGKIRHVLPGHPTASWQVAFTPDSRFLATAGYTECNVKMWDVATGNCIRTLDGVPERNWSVAISPCGRWIGSGSSPSETDRRTVVLWDRESGKRLSHFNIDPPWVWSIAFSPDSQTVATASDGGRVGLWRVRDGLPVTPVRGHDTAVRTLAFFPSGDTLVTGSDDRTIRLWDLATGEERLTLAGHTGSVWCVSVASDGSAIASSSRDGTVRLWRAATENDVRRQSAVLR